MTTLSDCTSLPAAPGAAGTVDGAVAAGCAEAHDDPSNAVATRQAAARRWSERRERERSFNIFSHLQRAATGADGCRILGIIGDRAQVPPVCRTTTSIAKYSP